MPKDLSSFFYPRSVAIVGASRSPEKVGAIVLKNIIHSKFKGQIYPINPNATTLEDLTCYKDIKSLPETPDLLAVAVTADKVLEVLDQAGQRGLKNAVVFSAGFKEIGGEGEKLEKDLIALANKYQMNILGPNCLGFVNNACPINVTFGQPVKQNGNLRFITQSGAIAASLFDWSLSTGLGFSEFVTLGNKAVLNENDILEFFHNHSGNGTAFSELSSVKPIGLYLESISDGPNFIKLSQVISKKDPVFIIKPGKTAAAATAMQSHTGAIAGEDHILGAVLEQSGVIRCDSLEDFFDLSRSFAWQESPVGANVAIISNAGGPAVISADSVIQNGLQLASIDQPTRDSLSKVLPRSASVLNPIDVLGDALAERYAQAAEILLGNDHVHSLLVILTPQIMTQIDKTAHTIGALSKKYKKPIFCSFIGGSKVHEGEQILNGFHIPSFRFPERAIYAIGSMWKFKKNQQIAAPSPVVALPFAPEAIAALKGVVEEASKHGHKALDNLEANELLSAIGIPTPHTQYVKTLDEAKKFALRCGWPVVLKMSSPALLHKKSVGGVVVGIKYEEQLDNAWHTLERKIESLEPSVRESVRIQAQKEVVSGVEVIIGVKRDPTFGPVLLFGAGGSLVELIGDRNLCLLPVGLDQVKQLVERSKIYSLLKGNNGEPPYALAKLYDLILRFSKLAEILPQASDLEINPVIVTLNDVYAVDAKIMLEPVLQKPTGPAFKVATTLSHKVEATTFHSFEFEPEKPFEFQPGQYASVKVASNRINCYSISSREGNARFSLFVDIRPGGPGSKFFEALKVGDKIAFLGPFGVMTYKPDDGANTLLFLGTGSGVSPLRCLIEYLLKEKNSTQPMVLYIRLNTPQDVFWVDIFEKLHQQFPNFTYKIVVWKPDATWAGPTGFITDQIKSDYPDASGCAAYLCGAKPMIDAAVPLLQQLGCPQNRIYMEKF